MPHYHRTKALGSLLLMLFLLFALLYNNNKASSAPSTWQASTPVTLTPISGAGGYPAPPVEITPLGASMTYKLRLPLISSPFDAFSLSYYVEDLNGLYDLGCATGQKVASFPKSKRGFVILDFGMPAYDRDPVYGTYGYGFLLLSVPRKFTPWRTLYSGVEEFIDGYYYCAMPISTATHLDLALGTYNSDSSVMNNSTKNNEHASEFGWFVQNMDNYATQYYGNVIRVSGAMDIEHDPDFYADPIPTKNWVNTETTFSGMPFYNFGTADCSATVPVGNETNYQPALCGPAGVPGLLWTQRDIYEVSTLAGWGYPYPEIYNTNTNAMQWYRIGIYSWMQGYTMVFRGTLTEWMACRQVDCAPDINNEPAIGYMQMATLVSSDNRLKDEMEWASDIMYQVRPTRTPQP
jgi:hypothetical protein